MNKRRRLTLLAFATLPGALFTATALAHHSTAIYDSDNPVELRGTVVEWKFTNPHCLIRLEVADGPGPPPCGPLRVEIRPACFVRAGLR